MSDYIAGMSNDRADPHDDLRAEIRALRGEQGRLAAQLDRMRAGLFNSAAVVVESCLLAGILLPYLTVSGEYGPRTTDLVGVALARLKDEQISGTASTQSDLVWVHLLILLVVLATGVSLLTSCLLPTRSRPVFVTSALAVVLCIGTFASWMVLLHYSTKDDFVWHSAPIFLTIGSLGVLGLSLPRALSARPAASNGQGGLAASPAAPRPKTYGHRTSRDQLRDPATLLGEAENR